MADKDAVPEEKATIVFDEWFEGKFSDEVVVRSSDNIFALNFIQNNPLVKGNKKVVSQIFLEEKYVKKLAFDLYSYFDNEKS